MIAIPCSECNRMIDIDTQVEPIKVPCYLLICQYCQIEVKNNERDKKLNKVLKRGPIERIMNFINSVMEWLK